MRTPHLLLFLMLAACTDTDDTADAGAKYGEFGVGLFSYRCPVAGDPTCPNGATTAPAFPRALALGSQLDLAFAWKAEEWPDEPRADPLPALRSVADSRLRDDGARFTALEPGVAGVYAITGNSEVVEIVHFEIAEIHELRVNPSPGLDPQPPLLAVDIFTGEERDLQGLVVDINDLQLGGILPYSWASEDPGVLEILSGSDGGLVRVRGVSTGATNLVLTQGERTLSLPVTVEPGLDTDTDNPTDATTTASTDATTTASTDATSGSTGTTGGAL